MDARQKQIAYEQIAYEHGFIEGAHCFHKWGDNVKKIIGLIYLSWKFSLFGVCLTGVILTFTDCAHFAEMFFLTNWTLLIVFLYSFVSLLAVILFRVELTKTVPFGAIRKQKGSTLKWKINLFLKYAVENLHPVAFSLTLWVMALYSIGTAGSISLSAHSLIAHFISPSMMIIDFWFSTIPWQINNVYKVSTYGNVYALFTALHYFFKLGHLSNVNGGCAASYEYSLQHPSECYVYKQFRMNEWISFLYILIMSNYLMPLLAFVIHVLQVFWIGGDRAQLYLSFIICAGERILDNHQKRLLY